MSDGANLIQVDTVQVNGRSVLRVRGEVNLHTAPRLRELLVESSRKLAGTMLLDLSAVTYMDSSGVGTMVYVKRVVEQGGRGLVLIGLQPRVRSLFEITHLDAFFRIADNLESVDGP